MNPPTPGAPPANPGDRRSGQVAMPALPRPHAMRGLGLYAALFGGVLILLLIAVILEDMALRDSLRIQAERDAQAVATQLGAQVQLRATAARAFSGLHAGGASPDTTAARIDRLLPALSTPRPLFDRIAIVHDTHGVLRDTSIAATRDAARTASRVTSPAFLALAAHQPAAGDGRSSHWVARLPGHDVVAIVVPLHRDSVAGLTFVGLTRAAALLENAVSDPAPRRMQLVVREGADTVLLDGTAADAPTRIATTYARVAASQPWRVDVLHEDTGPGVRATLWLLGGAAVLFLVLGLARERRQADRVAERSAELERLSTELLRSNRMKSEFLANVSHELRTPLNAIVGFVELLRDGVYGELSPRQTNPVERIAGSATHLRHLVDQVLDIAKMAAGRLEVHLESVVLRPFVLNVASELESLAADKGIVLSLTVGAALPRVRTDPSHLRQILVNLVGNAIKYTPTGGAVAIRTRLVSGPGGVSWRGPTPALGSMALPSTPGAAVPPTVEDELAPSALLARSPDPSRSWVAVQVSDTGIGIAPADHERIFEEFEQVNAGPRGESMQRGTGLGLPISRRLARLLGGDVSVESSLGKGATFTLWLPLEPAPQGQPALRG